MPRVSRVHIGISGWNYPSWRGVFYPKGLPQKQELAYASRTFDSIEVNGSFYSLLRPPSVAQWYEATPDGFVFSIKGSRFITHLKRLRDIEIPLANFFASGVLALRDKLGPILWQLPPSTQFDSERLEQFFDLLPRTTHAAANLARKHDHRLEGRAYLRPHDDRPILHALEVRHPTFGDPAFLALLRKCDIALCIADTAGRFPYFDGVTSNFVYVRLHGDTKLYESGYSKRALRTWAERIAGWQRKLRGKGDVYVYFDNDAKVRAPFDACTLRTICDEGLGRLAERTFRVCPAP
ncbi:DUF72 domain-containing protein [Pendulispora brunnea]|uniref:DUF72 domain-containing protein n=1 Tax=Pendulispora brunnea TaxID=2905690 RepID=A0ABZ2K4N3_9BACT